MDATQTVALEVWVPEGSHTHHRLDRLAQQLGSSASVDDFHEHEKHTVSTMFGVEGHHQEKRDGQSFCVHTQPGHIDEVALAIEHAFHGHAEITRSP